MAGSLLVLSGPVGAGKSTVAKALIALSPGPTTYIEGDAFWFFFAKPAAGEKPGTGRQRKLPVIAQAMFGAAVPYARFGQEVILDFSIPPWLMKPARERIADLDINYVVLRPSEAVCAARAAARTEGRIADYATYRDFYASFDETPSQFVLCPNEADDPMAVAAQIRDGVMGGRFCYPAA